MYSSTKECGVWLIAHILDQTKRVYLHTCYVLFLNNTCIQLKGQVQLFFYQQFGILNANAILIKKGNSVEMKSNNERKIQIQRKKIYSAQFQILFLNQKNHEYIQILNIDA